MPALPVLLFGGGNLFASVGIILVNKQIASGIGFHFILTVLFLNFISTGAFLEVSARCNYFDVKHMPEGDRWKIAVMAMLTVLLNNASNEANSVGFYQISKLLIIPTVIGIERLNGVWRTYSRGVVISLTIAALGVAIATVSDFEINVRGSILAGLSILMTAQYQIWQRGKQLEHGLSAMQITHTVSWPQSFVGLLAMLLLDVSQPWLKEWLLLRPGGLSDHQRQNASDPLWIVACCCIAVVMNISTYGLLGKVSPVTYQVLGQFKTCLIVGLGYLFFDMKAPPLWLAIRFSGVGIAIIGILSYAVQVNKKDEKSKDEKSK